MNTIDAYAYVLPLATYFVPLTGCFRILLEREKGRAKEKEKEKERVIVERVKDTEKVVERVRVVKVQKATSTR